MSITTFQPMIRAAEVWAGCEESPELRPSHSIGEIDRNAAELVLSRIRSDRFPVIIECEKSRTNGSAHLRTATLAIPIITEGEVRSALILAIICPEECMGAFEIWTRDHRDELGLNGAVFARLSRFGSISKNVKFPRGSGLPGKCWQDREAKIITGLGRSPNFMRAAGARAGGLDLGVALPIMTTEFELSSVILLLSSKATPIARMFEIWDVDEEHRVAELRADAHTSCDATDIEAKSMTYTPGEGIVGRVWESGHPLVTCELSHFENKRNASFAANNLSTAIAWPIYVGNSIQSIFVMLT